MKDLNINRDTDQPSDEALLKHQNFDEILEKANVKNMPNTANLVSKKWWYFSVGSFVVVGVVVLAMYSMTNTSIDIEKSYITENQPIELIEKIEASVLVFQNNISTSKIIQETNVGEENIDKVITDKKEEKPPLKTLAYYYPKEVSTLTFKLDEAFGLKDQYQEFEEFSIYDNLAFQPIGDYQSGWLKASWTKVVLVKKSDNYFLMLSKNGGTFPCQVVPVFESEDYVKALDDYANALK